ncbi:hypothetical protein [Photobacterium leiognathi]|uniref:hypothetical protein n=1 Tax=Photobacterium leiognathi TaxID=553611 RepID=UPI002982A347|nr:hypothetical protein [Photobacterium leiognathi]
MNTLFKVATLPFLISLSLSAIAHETAPNSVSTHQFSTANDAPLVVYPVEGVDVTLPNDAMNIIVYIQNAQWARYVDLPTEPSIGTVVKIKRTSAWETSARTGDKEYPVPNVSTSKFVWDGDQWKNTNIETGNITTLKHKGMYQVSLNDTVPQAITPLVATPTSVTANAEPAISDLNAMSIDSNGTFFNNTAYSIHGVYVEREGEKVYLGFETAINPYSSAAIGDEWANATIIKMTRLGNNKFDLLNPNPPGTEARHANEAERDSVERLHMYERYFVNAPSTLWDITKLVAEKCEINEGYSDCKNYAESAMDYASDMYFAQSVSGVTSAFWVDTTVWALATMPAKEMYKSKINSYQTLWMSPELMQNMYSDNQWTAIDAEQGMIHEYYHNLGFYHTSGWASYQGIDDLFGDKAYFDYRNSVGDRYVTSNLVVDAEKVGTLEYAFDVSALGDISDLEMRVLSTQGFDASVRQTETNKVFLTFDQVPSTDIYVSFYSKESQQMATVTLDSFITTVSGQAALSNLHNVFADLVAEYNKVMVYTANGAWVRNFHLPAGVEGSIVVFQSQAGWNSHIFYDGHEDVLSYGNRLEYQYTDGRWVKLASE